jgi:predicted nucleic acid-binding protein
MHPYPEAPVGQLKSFLDTSAAIKLRAGHRAHKEYLSANIPRPHYVNNYVRMEFYKALLMHWIHFYFESGDELHRTFADAVTFWTDRFGREPKALLAAIAHMLADGFSPDDRSQKEVCRQKLLDLIFTMAIAFESAYKDTGVDPTHCARLGRALDFGASGDRDIQLLEFEKRFGDSDSSRSNCWIESLFRNKKFAGDMARLEEDSRQKPSNDALGKMHDSLEKGVQDSTQITCTSCGKMGDAVIAVSMPSGWELHSLDEVHATICTALDKGFKIHPSLAKLRKNLGGV